MLQSSFCHTVILLRTIKCFFSKLRRQQKPGISSRMPLPSFPSLTLRLITVKHFTLKLLSKVRPHGQSGPLYFPLPIIVARAGIIFRVPDYTRSRTLGPMEMPVSPGMPVSRRLRRRFKHSISNGVKFWERKGDGERGRPKLTSEGFEKVLEVCRPARERFSFN
jgi:hypothetical protein